MSFHFSSLALVALFGAGTLLHADTCTFAGPLVVGSPNVETCDTGSQSAPPNSFSLTQFNPDLGPLSDGIFTPSGPVAVAFTLTAMINGDSSITVYTPPCYIPTLNDGCLAPNWTVDASVSAEAAGITATAEGTYTSSTDFYGQPLGTDTLPVTWSVNSSNVVNFTATDFTASQAGPWTGVGALTFNLAASAENATFSFPGGPTVLVGYPLDFASVTGVNYDANVQYSFVYDPTPEPSFLLVTGALFGLISLRRVVGRQN
jgi:hypothetical protein